MKREFVATGGSLAATLPADMAQELGLEEGQEVDASFHPVTHVITLRPPLRLYEDGKVTERVEADIDRLLRENAQVYERLAK